MTKKIVNHLKAKAPAIVTIADLYSVCNCGTDPDLRHNCRGAISTLTIADKLTRQLGKSADEIRNIIFDYIRNGAPILKIFC